MPAKRMTLKQKKAQERNWKKFAISGNIARLQKLLDECEVPFNGERLLKAAKKQIDAGNYKSKYK